MEKKTKDVKKDSPSSGMVKGGARVFGLVTGDNRFIGMPEAERMGLEVLTNFIDGRKQAEIRLNKEKAVGVYGKVDGQQQQEITEAEDRNMYGENVITPPYTMDLLSELLYKNVTHNACVETKAGDYSYHGWELMQKPELKGVSKAELDEAREEVNTFLNSCVDGLLPIEDLIRDLALDYEALGVCAFEVIRNSKGIVVRLNHIPASTLRVLKVAVTGKTDTQHFVQCRFNKKRYFMPFGGTVSMKDKTFDPLSASYKDFPKLKARGNAIVLNKPYMSRDEESENVKDPRYAATELFWMCRPPRNKSTVYGTPAGVAAYSDILGELRAGYYNLSYFNSKGVPQFAVILENPNPVYAQGAAPRESGEVDPTAAAAAAVEEFFAKNLKTSDRNVLVMEGVGGTKIRFEKLSPDSIDDVMLKYADACRESTRLSHRVPPAALGIIEAANLGSGRESSQMLRYRNHIVTPGQRIFAAMVNTIIKVGLLIPYFEFVFHLMPVDDEQDRRAFKLKEYELGAITPNEYRSETKRQVLSDPSGNDGIGNSLIIRNAQISIASPDGTITTTKPGDATGSPQDTANQDLGNPVNPAAPADVGK